MAQNYWYKIGFLANIWRQQTVTDSDWSPTDFDSSAHCWLLIDSDQLGGSMHCVLASFWDHPGPPCTGLSLCVGVDQVVIRGGNQSQVARPWQKFFCLGRVDDDSTGSTVYQYELQLNNLGLRRIQVKVDSDHYEVWFFRLRLTSNTGMWTKSH